MLLVLKSLIARSCFGFFFFLINLKKSKNRPAVRTPKTSFKVQVDVYTKELLAVFLRFKFNWESYILLGNPSQAVRKREEPEWDVLG